MVISFLELLPFQRMLSPNGVFGWLAWLGLAALVGLLTWRIKPGLKLEGRQWSWLPGLTVLVPIAILLISIRLPNWGALAIPALGPPAIGPLLPVLAAVPWVLASVLLGPVSSVCLAALSGLLLAFWDTRSPFTPLELALLAALFSAAVRQTYRTRFFSWLRQPLVASIIVSAAYPFVYLFTAFFWASADPTIALDFALSRLPSALIAVALPIILAGLALQFLQQRVPAIAVVKGEGQPAPGERSLEGRLLFTLGPIVLLAFLALGALSWWTAGRAAEDLLRSRVQASTELAANSVPFLLETGQNLMLQLAADTRLADSGQETALAILQSHLRTVPYFEQLTLLDTGGNTIAGVPVADFDGLQPGDEELQAVALAIQGLSFQVLTVPPLDPEATAAQLSFVAAVHNDSGQVRGVLVGRTGLNSNPFAQPIVQSLDSIEALGGQGFLIDGAGRIALASSSAAILQPYNGRSASEFLAYDDSAQDGSRLFVTYLPVTGSNWAVVAQWPARLSQSLALDLVLPILGVLALLAAAAYLLLRYSLRAVTSPLQSLIGETRRIASGDLREPVTVGGADEVGRLASSFESMRQTLQARVEEIQRLLSVSEGLSSSLDVRAHIEPILDAALASGAGAARLVFSSNGDSKGQGYGRGKAGILRDLDEQMLALSRKQERVLITNPARARLKVSKGVPIPESIAAFALQHNQEHLGTLWLAYDKPQAFPRETVRYLETLAEQAAKAAVNARLYSSANVGRQRLESLLQADPDAIVILDEMERVAFANSAANQMLQTKDATNPSSIERPQLSALLAAVGETSAEIEIDNVKYLATVNPLGDGNQRIGKVIRLQDLAQVRQAETARKEFLSTLSHDLHDPLELTKGYLNMLGMVGDLNEQQTGYIQKIEHNLENISRLAASLLDLERISGLKGLDLQPFSFADLIQEVCDDLSPRARQKKIDYLLKEFGPVQLVNADRTLLQRALYNLLDNAIKFSPREGVVELRSVFDAEKVKISVTDHGAGIAPLDLPSIFDAKVVKGRKSSGLAIVKSIVDRHRGTVKAESELGSGSTFTIEIPLTAA